MTAESLAKDKGFRLYPSSGLTTTVDAILSGSGANIILARTNGQVITEAEVIFQVGDKLLTLQPR